MVRFAQGLSNHRLVETRNIQGNVKVFAIHEAWGMR